MFGWIKKNHEKIYAFTMWITASDGRQGKRGSTARPLPVQGGKNQSSVNTHKDLP